MRSKIVLALLSALAFSSCCSVSAVKVLNLNVTYSEAYCGGAAPSEEMMNEVKSPKPYSGELYLYSDFEFNSDPVTIDIKNGKARLKCFAQGDYILSRRKIKTPADLAGFEGDPECERTWSRMEHTKMKVGKSDKELNVHMNYSCDPCALPAP